MDEPKWNWSEFDFGAAGLRYDDPGETFHAKLETLEELDPFIDRSIEYRAQSAHSLFEACRNWQNKQARRAAHAANTTGERQR